MIPAQTFCLREMQKDFMCVDENIRFQSQMNRTQAHVWNEKWGYRKRKSIFEKSISVHMMTHKFPVNRNVPHHLLSLPFERRVRARVHKKESRILFQQKHEYISVLLIDNFAAKRRKKCSPNKVVVVLFMRCFVINQAQHTYSLGNRCFEIKQKNKKRFIWNSISLRMANNYCCVQAPKWKRFCLYAQVNL